MQVYLCNSHQSLLDHCNSLYVRILMDCLYQGIRIIAGHVEMTLVSSFPIMFENDFFWFVINIINIGADRLAIFCILRMEYWEWAQIEEMKKATIAVLLRKSEFRLSHNSTHLVYNIVLFEGPWVIGITMTHKLI